MILLIKNGHVINPATETDEVADILAEDGKVVKMEKNIKAKADLSLIHIYLRMKNNIFIFHTFVFVLFNRV